ALSVVVAFPLEKRATKFDKCNDNIDILDVTISPDPLTPLKSLTMNASGKVKNTVEEGVVEANVLVLNENNSVNDSFLGGDFMLTAKKGKQFNALININPLPNNFKIVMTVTASDDEGNTIGCANKTFDFLNKN
ncbi:14197_t:CDS:1, partial [Dentiscutata heterogama]